MFSWPGPDVRLTWQSARTGIENKWFALTGRVVAVKVEADGDLRIALQARHRFVQLATVTQVREICCRMSRFRARRCIKEYKTILFRKKETPAGGNHPGRPGNFHPNICANHYHL